MPPQFRHRMTKKEPRRSPGPAALEERIEEIMDRVHQAGHNKVERVAAPEEYLTLTRAHEGETWFDAGAWSEDLADSYLALGRVDDAVRTISNTTRSGCAEGRLVAARGIVVFVTTAQRGGERSDASGPGKAPYRLTPPDARAANGGQVDG